MSISRIAFFVLVVSCMLQSLHASKDSASSSQFLPSVPFVFTSTIKILPMNEKNPKQQQVETQGTFIYDTFKTRTRSETTNGMAVKELPSNSSPLKLVASCNHMLIILFILSFHIQSLNTLEKTELARKEEEPTCMEFEVV